MPTLILIGCAIGASSAADMIHPDSDPGAVIRWYGCKFAGQLVEDGEYVTP